jgi:hypothetical protein
LSFRRRDPQQAQKLWVFEGLLDGVGDDGDDGTVRLLGARIGGQFGASDASVRNDTGPALFGDRLQVDGGLFLDAEFTASSGNKHLAMVLSGPRQLTGSSSLVAGPLGFPLTLASAGNRQAALFPIHKPAVARQNCPETATVM